MAMRALLLLAVAAVASSASIGSQMCCGPDEWEAMAIASAAASSQSMSGSLSVDHPHRMAALYLMHMKADVNMSMTINMNGSNVFIYFMMHHMQQSQDQPEPTPVCAAYVLKNVMSDLSSSCFPSDHSHSDAVDSLPVKMLAYEYAGLAGLLTLQMFANAADCRPMMLGLNSGSNDGPHLGILLSNMKSGVSDRSMLDQPPALCAQTMPLEILIPDGGFDKRQGSLGSGDWIDDLVLMYILRQIRTPHMDPRPKRDLKDVLAIHSKDDQPNLADVMERAMALRQLMQHFSDFIGPIDNGTDNGNGSHRIDQSDLEALAEFMIERNLLSQLMSGHSHEDHRRPNDNRQPFDQSDLEALLALMLERNLIDRFGPRQDGEDQLIQLARIMAELQMISSNDELVRHIMQYELLHNLDSSQGGDLSQLLRLAMLQAIMQQNQRPVPTPFKLMEMLRDHSAGPNFSNLLKLMEIQQHQDGGMDLPTLLKLMGIQQHQDGSIDLPTLLKLMGMKQHDDESSIDLPTLLKLMGIQQHQDGGIDLPTLMKLMGIQQNQDGGIDLPTLMKLMGIQQHQDGGIDLPTLLKLMGIQQSHDGGIDLPTLLKLMGIQQHQDGSIDLPTLLKLMGMKQHDDESSIDLPTLLKLMGIQQHQDGGIDLPTLLKLMGIQQHDDGSIDLPTLLKWEALQQHH